MPDLLHKYRSMRNFGDTPEPAGGKKKPTKLPIFVIQKHAASHLHYDFRLEMEGVLKSWAIPKGPSYDPSVKRLAMMTEDHPYDYAKFEGVIPAGNYGAGNVIIWDEGGWEFIEPGDDPVKALRSGKLTFRMYGKKMFGEWALVKIHGRGSSDRGNEWLLLKHRDEFANEQIDITEFAPRSVVSNRTIEDVDPANTWESNRKSAGGRGTPTVASKLEAEREARTSKKRSASRTKKATTTKRGTTKATSKRAAKSASAKKTATTRKSTGTKARAKKTSATKSAKKKTSR